MANNKDLFLNKFCKYVRSILNTEVQGVWDTVALHESFMVLKLLSRAPPAHVPIFVDLTESLACLYILESNCTDLQKLNLGSYECQNISD